MKNDGLDIQLSTHSISEIAIQFVMRDYGLGVQFR